VVLAREPIEQREVNQTLHTRRLPVAQASPACHPSTAAQFLWQHLPRDAAAEDKENAGEARSVIDARSSTLRSSWWNRKERFDEVPQRIRKQRAGHGVHVTAPGEGPTLYPSRSREVLLHDLILGEPPVNGVCEFRRHDPPCVYYYEKIVHRETGELILLHEGRLSEHRGHGSANT
jgi:hypothetical protein